VHDHLGDALLGLGRHFDAFEQRHDYRGVHVEGERRRWAAPAQGLIGDCVIEEVGAGATPFARDGQRQEAFVAKALVIFDRMACIAVVPGRAGREIGRQLAAPLLQMLLLLGEPEIHAGGLLAVTRADLAPGTF